MYKGDVIAVLYDRHIDCCSRDPIAGQPQPSVRCLLAPGTHLLFVALTNRHVQAVLDASSQSRWSLDVAIWKRTDVYSLEALIACIFPMVG